MNSTSHLEKHLKPELREGCRRNLSALIFVVIFFIAALIMGCDRRNAKKVHSADDTIYEINGVFFKKYILDSCEYIGRIGTYGSDFFIHKGNCKFCEARQRNKMHLQIMGYPYPEHQPTWTMPENRQKIIITETH